MISNRTFGPSESLGKKVDYTERTKTLGAYIHAARRYWKLTMCLEL